MSFDPDFPSFHRVLRNGNVRFELITDDEIIANTLIIRRFDPPSPERRQVSR
jgi:hypothetical protein